MAYEIIETIKGDAVGRQLRTLEPEFDRVLTVDIEAGENIDETQIDLTPNITMEVFSDESAWDVEYGLVLRVGSDPYRFVWVTGDIDEFLQVALDDIDDDMNGIQQIHVIDGDDAIISAVTETDYNVIGPKVSKQDR